ncbi:stress-responsive transcription factor hsf1 [Mortierella alpina]|uniref:Stress-responsive transcription factor hsf1 n=1 Tax=Mortierella alpina TaxID=64518 RepID=A0A9P6LWU4_MORAP|nr:stress-responsive transcription factor hsf1 [Mortierella alpina]
MFSTDDGSAPDSPIIPSSTNPRIFELSAKSPLSLTLDDLHSSISTANGTINPIITTPGSVTPSYMPSHGSDDMDFSGRSPDTMSPSARSALALINTAQGLQQQQQQYPHQQQSNGLASEATLALLSGLVPSTGSADALAQTSYGASRPGGHTSSNGVNSSGAQSSPTSQSLQPLTRQTNGARGNVAAFLTKLYKMVGDAGSNNLIKWSDNGQSFLVLNHVEFAKVVLPKFFKHNNFSSFVRQLNMYGFHKVPHLQQGVLLPDADTEQWEFSNPHFQRNQPDLLYLVSRKKATAGNEDKDALTMDLNHILQEVSAIKRHQVAISSDLKNIERDHQSLWQESLAARERHQRQQETIDKILRFLASVFSGEKKRAIVPSKKPRLTITDGDNDDEASSSLNDGMRLVEEEEEEEEEEDEEEEEEVENMMTGYKRKRDSNDEGARVINVASSSKKTSASTPANSKQKEQKSVSAAVHKNNITTGGGLPSLPTVSAASSAVPNLPDYLAAFPGLNYANPNNVANILNLPGAPFKFDPSTLSIPTTALLPNAVLSPAHHDMLRSISMANSHNSSSSGTGKNMTLSTAPALASLPPAFAQTQAGSSVAKGVDQITQEMEQLERSIEALRQHGLNVDNFDFDDDTYLSLANSYDSNGYGDLGNSYQDVMTGTDSLNGSNYLTASSSASAVPSTSPTSSHSNSATSVGPNPRITTVDEEEYLEDLLDLDTV